MGKTMAAHSDKNFRVTNNNAVDMHVGKRVRLHFEPCWVCHKSSLGRL